MRVWVSRCGRVYIDQRLIWVSSSITLPPPLFFFKSGSLIEPGVHLLSGLTGQWTPGFFCLLPTPSLVIMGTCYHCWLFKWMPGIWTQVCFTWWTSPRYQIKHLELIFAVLCPGMNRIWIQFYGEFSHCLTIPRGWKLYEAVIFWETSSIHLSILMSPWKVATAPIGTDMLS